MTKLVVMLARALNASPTRAWATYALGNIPGLPPLVQTVHILGITAIMASVVMIDLRLLGLALPGQHPRELARRLLPWMWWALPALALSGLMFLCARPNRYLFNRVFAWKFAFMAPAIALGLVLQWMVAQEGFWDEVGGRRMAARVIALCSVLLWIGVVMAGRFIAYADYIFPPE
jgi:hypothetical protein